MRDYAAVPVTGQLTCKGKWNLMRFLITLNAVIMFHYKQLAAIYPILLHRVKSNTTTTSKTELQKVT